MGKDETLAGELRVLRRSAKANVRADRKGTSPLKKTWKPFPWDDFLRYDII